MNENLPPLPAGFTLDAPADGPAGEPQGLPPLPPGFTLDQPAEQQAEPQQGQWLQRIGAKLAKIDAPRQQQLTPEWQNEALQTAREVTRQVGRTGQMLATGGASVVTVPYDALMGLVDLALERGGFKFRLSGAGQALRELVEHPELADRDATERVVRMAGESLSAAGGGISVGSSLTSRAPGVAQRVGEALAAAPAGQAASAVTGSVASGVTREMGGGPVAQTAAGVAGALVPSTRSAGRALIRGVVRGGEAGRQTVEQNIKAFRDVGATPTVGQATEGRGARGFESLLSRTPGGSGRIIGFAEQQADEIGAGLERQVATISPKASAAQAGRAIERGISNGGGFLERFKSTARTLYDAIDQHIAPDTEVSAQHTVAKLNQLTHPIKGAEETAKMLANPKLVQIRDALHVDMSGASGVAKTTLPYTALREVRTRVGELLASNDLVSDVPRGQLKQLYGAITADMKQAAAQSGPQAQHAFNRASRFYEAGMKRVDLLQRVVNRNGGPEAVFRAATSGTKEGATTLRAVMQSLPKDEQKMLAAAVIRRLGLAKPGVQTDLADQFSSETFLTNWGTLSAEARRVLFGRFGNEFSKKMDQVARIAVNLRVGSAVFKNPSGTAQAVTQAGTAGAFIYALATGQMQGAGTIAGVAIGANLMARLMTNPKFVGFLADATKFPASQAPALLNQFIRLAAKEDDPDLQEAAEVLWAQQSPDRPYEQ